MYPDAMSFWGKPLCHGAFIGTRVGPRGLCWKTRVVLLLAVTKWGLDEERRLRPAAPPHSPSCRAASLIGRARSSRQSQFSTMDVRGPRRPAPPPARSPPSVAPTSPSYSPVRETQGSTGPSSSKVVLHEQRADRQLVRILPNDPTPCLLQIRTTFVDPDHRRGTAVESGE